MRAANESYALKMNIIVIFKLLKFSFAHNTLLSFLSYYKEYFIILRIGQDRTSLSNACLGMERRPCTLPRTLLSFTNNNPFYIKQLLHSQNNRNKGRSAHPTLLLSSPEHLSSLRIICGGKSPQLQTEQ